MSTVLVVDASVVVDWLGRFRPEPLELVLFASGAVLAAPELLDVEVLQVLRRLDLSGAIPSSRADLLDSLSALRIRRYPYGSLLPEIWALRHNISAYDAAYVALARQLNATLVTRDQKLAQALSQMPELSVGVASP
jgi:predicted nucleic acid-binding protein